MRWFDRILWIDAYHAKVLSIAFFLRNGRKRSNRDGYSAVPIGKKKKHGALNRCSKDVLLEPVLSAAVTSFSVAAIRSVIRAPLMAGLLTRSCDD